VKYGQSSVEYRTFDAAATDVLRLSFKPSRVTAGGRLLQEHNELGTEGYTLRPLTGGDWVLRILHSSSGEIGIAG